MRDRMIRKGGERQTLYYYKIEKMKSFLKSLFGKSSLSGKKEIVCTAAN